MPEQPKKREATRPAPESHEQAAVPEAAAPTRSTRHIAIIAAAIFLIVTGSVALTADDLGLTWDEVPYRDSQIQMAAWFRALANCRSTEQASRLLSKQSILDAWEYNRYGPNFHPPLAGVLCHGTYALFGGVLGDLGSRRLASGMELALAATVLFVFLARRYGTWVGGVAAAALVLTPRVFGHAHIAGTDMPLMAFWAFTALAFWKGLESGAWRIAFGILLVLSLLVKFNAILLVAPILVWVWIYRAVPAWNMAAVVTAVLGTLIIAGPLLVAGVEIVRLAQGIRLFTQREMMLPAGALRVLEPDLPKLTGHEPPYSEAELRTLVDRRIEELVGHGPPYTESQLRYAALRLVRELAERQGTSLEAMIGHEAPFSARELGRVCDRLRVPALALDGYVAWVQPKRNLGVTTAIGGWIFFVPLGAWLVWSLASSLPIAPAALRESGAVLRMWLAGLAIAPALAVALNPTWWHDTLPQLAHFYQISVGRQGALPDIEIFYLGQKYIYSLPWHNGWVLIAVTVPAAILAFALIGIAAAFRQMRTDPLRMFFVLQMMVLPVSRMFPTPAHDGVRLMLPTFFFLAGLAGWGFEWVERLVERFRSEEYSTAPVLAVAAAFLLGPPAYWLLHTHPYELSYYNGLVGGLAGAQKIGFEPTYWYDAVTPAVLEELNDPERGVPVGGTLSLPEPRSIVTTTTPPRYWESDFVRGLPEPRINPLVFDTLWLEDKRLRHHLRKDIRMRRPDATDFPHVALLTHSSKAGPFTRILYAMKPRRSWGHDGVRLFSLYDPEAVARAWGLWLLLDATDYSRAVVEPRVDRAVIAIAARDYRAVAAAALRITEAGVDAALANAEDEATLHITRKLAERGEALHFLLARRSQALVEAAEILNHAAEKRPERLEQLVETYDGYLPQSVLGEFLDER